MAERSDVVDRADALMRRRNSFVTTSGKRPESEDDDLPVLTEVVPAEPLETGAGDSAVTDGPVEAAEPLEALPELFADTVMPPVDPAAAKDADLEEERIARLAAEIGEAVAQQMRFELPTLIEAALVKAGEELRAGITSTINDAVQEFIAQRKRPPQDPK
jgi:hypothetical protein